MKPVILVLDNDPPRHEMFRAAAWDMEIVHTYQVSTLEELLQETGDFGLISLDHDLGPLYSDRPPDNSECGCDAAELVVELASPGVPVLIHSANTPCAQIMRRILVQSGRRGRVARINTATVSEYGDEAGVATIRGAIQELLASPLWPEDLETNELLDMLGDDCNLICPSRAARRST